MADRETDRQRDRQTDRQTDGTCLCNRMTHSRECTGLYHHQGDKIYLVLRIAMVFKVNHVRVTCSCSSLYLKIYNNAIIWGSAQCAHIVSLSLSGTGLCSSVNPFCKSETLHQFRLTCMVQKQPEPVSTNSVSSWSGWLDPRWTLGSCLYGDRCTLLPSS